MSKFLSYSSKHMVHGPLLQIYWHRTKSKVRRMLHWNFFAFCSFHDGLIVVKIGRSRRSQNSQLASFLFILIALMLLQEFPCLIFNAPMFPFWGLLNIREMFLYFQVFFLLLTISGFCFIFDKGILTFACIPMWMMKFLKIYSLNLFKTFFYYSFKTLKFYKLKTFKWKIIGCWSLNEGFISSVYPSKWGGNCF